MRRATSRKASKSGQMSTIMAELVVDGTIAAHDRDLVQPIDAPAHVADATFAFRQAQAMPAAAQPATRRAFLQAPFCVGNRRRVCYNAAVDTLSHCLPRAGGATQPDWRIPSCAPRYC